ncbi:MAG: paraquat-inducible protein A [Sulfuricaulis sp.]
MVIALVILCQQIISNTIANQKNKKDYAELNNVKYGFLSVDKWKTKITPIVEDEINKLHLSKANERVLKKHIEALLNTLIDKVEKNIREANATTLKGRAAQSFIDAFIRLDDIKKDIPEYADAVIHEIKKPTTKRQIKSVLNQQFKQYSDKTFNTQDTSVLSGILRRTDSPNIESARIKIDSDISTMSDRIDKESLLLITLGVMLFAMSGFSKQTLRPPQYMLLVLSLIVLLIAGVATPMIDMEATIPQLSLELMGHSIRFENQVLYFQSKSILDVFWIMITHKAMQMKLVGAMLVTFSIIFPVLKLLSTLGHYFNYRHARENPVIKFFVFNSGKWSMADVMVIAIFMAYVGFNEIITNEFGKLKSAGQEQNLMLLTTNATSLQPGFYLFLTYTLLALFLSVFLARKPRAK